MPIQHADSQKSLAAEQRKVNTPEAPAAEAIAGLTSAQSTILRMQTTQGNAAVRRKLAGITATRVQRDTASDPFILDGVTINTKGDLIAFYENYKQRLLDAGRELAKDNLSGPASMLLGPIAAQRNQDALKGKESEPVDASDHAKANGWFDTFSSAMADSERTKATAAAAKINEAIAKLTEAANRISSDVVPDMKDLERKKFASGSSNDVLQMADNIATALDSSLTMKSGILTLRTTNNEMLANELKWLGKGTAPTLQWLPKVLEVAEKVDKAYAAFQLVRAAMTVAGGASTSAEEGRNAVSAMSTVIGAGGTLLGASAGLTLYANLYIGPMVDKCLDQLSKIEDMIKSQNLTMMHEGMWDAVVWSVEQGGKATFDFMVQVMHAGSADQISNTLPADVSKLLMNKEDSLNAGVKKGNPMPTSGSLFWKKPDPDKINSWLFSSRQSIWAMLYGGSPVP